MAYVFAEGGYGAAATVIHTDSSHPDVISIPDVDLLRSGTFHRVGVDLHLNGHDGQRAVIPGYFASEHPPALVGPDGGRLTADVIAQLAGHEQLAAAQPASANDATTHFDHSAIGHVDKITGDVTVVRDGVSVTLHAGDAVYKSDIIQTGGGAAVAISFADGTAVHLAANTRMVLTSFSFDPTSNSNDALFTLTDGTFAFVGGKIAHDGVIKIATEVATMRVHEGTFGWAHHLTAAEISSISAKLGSVTYAFAVVNEHGADTHGIYDLLVNDGVVGNVDDPNLVSYLDSDGNLITMPFDHSGELATDLPQDLFQWLDEDIATRSLQGIHGSGGPIDLPAFPTPVNLNQLGPTFDFDPNAGGGLFSGLLTPANNSQPIFFVNNGLFIWNGFGDWDLNPLNWQAGFAPTSSLDTVIIQTGKSNYNNFYSIGSLTVDFGATLNIASGTLTVGGLTNSGLIEVNSSGVDPALIMNGAIELTGGGTIEMRGPTADNFILGVDSSSLVNVDNLIEGSGNIGAGDGHLTFVNEATVDATPLLASDSGLLVINTGNPVANFGTFEATLKGELQINDQFFNFNLIEAVGVGSTVFIDNNSRDAGSVPGNASVNTGLIEAISGGTVTIEDTTIVNSGVNAEGAIVDGIIEAAASSQLLFSNATILKGFVTVAVGGEIQTVSGTSNLVDTSNGSHNATQFTIINDGLVLVNDNSSLTLGSSFDIGNAGTIEVSSTGDKTELLFTEPVAILSGGGDVILEGAAIVEPPLELLREGEGEGVKGSSIAQNVIDGVTGAGFSTVTLENLDNTISGSGSIGEGTTALTFKNDARGIVDADLFRQEIVIDTGANTILNAGLFEATNSGLLQIESELHNSGQVIAQEASGVLIEADVINESHGKIVARGFASGVGFLGNPTDPISVDNSGVIAARQGGTVLFAFADITNEGKSDTAAAGRIASGEYSYVEIDDSIVNNSGVIVAKHGGTIDSYYDTVTNEADGLILATGKDSEVNFFEGSVINESDGNVVARGSEADVSFQGISSKDKISVDNSGVIAARNAGTVSFDYADIINEGASASTSEPAGVIVASGSYSTVQIENSTVNNSGVIEAKHGGAVDFDDDWVTNESGGLILATGKHSEVSFDRHHVENFGEISAEHRGTVIFEHTYVDNDKGGRIEAEGQGSKVSFDHGHVDNSGRIEAENRGEVTFTELQVDNDHHGSIEADGRGSVVAFDGDTVDNSGHIKAEERGTVEFRESLIKNDSDATIEAKGSGSEVKFENDGVENRGWIGATLGGSVLLEDSGIKNGSTGVITADGGGSEVKFEGGLVDNSGVIVAIYGGEVKFDDTRVDNDNTIGAAFGGTVDLDHTHVDNRDGVILAVGPDSTVDLDSASISGGDLGTALGGLISAKRGTSTFDNLAITPGSEVEVGAKLELKGRIDNSGTITVAKSGELDLVDVTVNGGRIDNHHTIDVFGDDTLEGGLIVTGGDMVLKHDATLHIEGTATLDGVDVDNRDGTIIVDRNNKSATLTLDDGTMITGGSLLVNGDGTLDIEKGPWGPDATLDGLGVSNDGTIDLGTNATLTIGHTVTLNGTGAVSMASGSKITDNGSAATLDNLGNTISGEGTIGGSKLTLTNGAAGIIDANVHDKTMVIDPSVVNNNGTLEATNGATIDIKSNVANGTAGLIAAIGNAHSTVELEAITVTNGTISIAATNTFEIENGTTTLTGVNVENNGNLQIDHVNSPVTATLVLGTGTSIDGNITVGASGELDISGGTFNGDVTIYDYGIFDINTPLTLDDNVTIHQLGSGTFADTGAITVDDNASVTLSGAKFGELDIGAHATLTLDNAKASVVDFTGADGTLVLKEPTDFTGTIEGLTAGDVIDLAGVSAKTVTFDGTTLKINGSPSSFTISGGLPAGDVLAFKDDGHGGTELKVLPQLLSLSATSVSGQEKSDIKLGFTEATTGGAKLTSYVISGIPVGATLSDGQGHSFTATMNSTSVDVHAWTLGSLTITPVALADFTLSAAVMARDSNGFSYSATTTEQVHVTTPPGPPVFSSPSTASVNEGISAGTVVYTTVASDPTNAPITYSLSGADASHFTINANGVVTINAVPSFETQSSYHFNVVASEAGFTGHEAVTLSVVDLPPTFTSSTTATVNEGTSTSTVVYTAHATEPGGGTLTYSLSGTDANAFNLNANTGALTFKAVPNYDVQHSYDVIIHANETGGGTLSADQEVTITVDAVAPTFSSPATANINEGVAKGTTVYTAAATEPGGGTLTYSLVAGQNDDAADFSINAQTGAVTINTAPSHETQGVYHFTVQATEQSGLATTEAVTLDVVDQPPVFSSPSTSTVHHGTSADTVVYTAAASEPGGGSLTYSLVGGLNDDAANFTINAQTGAVIVNDPVSYAAHKVYHFTVEASEAIGGPSSTEAVTVNVTPTFSFGGAPVDNDQPSIALDQIVVSQNGGSGEDIPVGAIRTFAGVTIPFGFEANGQSLPINQEISLFSAIGNTYGGNGQNTFQLPNLAGAVAVGQTANLLNGSSQSPGIALGTQFGSDQFSLNNFNLPPQFGGSGTFHNDQPSLAINYLIRVYGEYQGDATDNIGDVIPYLGPVGGGAPAGFMFAQGQTLPIEEYQALFSLIGTTYGGNGQTTFQLPNLSGATIVGAGGNIRPGTVSGHDTGTIVASNLPSPVGSDLPISNDQPTVALNYIIALQGIFPGNQTTPGSAETPEVTPYLGEIMAYAGAGPVPQGWALAAGQLLPIQQYTALFAIMGTTYGGNGTSTFALPNLVGRVVVGAGTNAIGSSTPLGDTYGSDNFTLNGSNVSLAPVPGSLTVASGATVEIPSPTNQKVVFAGATGELKIDNPGSFTGHIGGFTGTAPDAAHSDAIDLVGIDYKASGFAEHYNAATGVLDITDGTHSAQFTFDNFGGTLHFASDGSGGTLIFDPPTGPATIAGGESLMITAADNGNVTFADATGKLQLGDPASFSGHIAGFTGTDAAHSDTVDISGFDPASTVFTEKSVDGNLVVTATDGSNVATLTFDHVDGMLNFASDGHGGAMITNASASTAPDIGTVDSTVSEAGVNGTITAADPGTSATLTTSVTAMGANDLGELSVHPATSANGTVSVAFNFNPDQANVAAGQTVTQSYDVAVSEGASTILHQTVSVSMGGAGSDNFVFAPGVGADTILNFDATRDTIDLSHFTNVQAVQQLEALTTTNAHGDAVIDLGNHDSITIAGMTAAQFQQVMQSTVHLH